MYYLYTDGGSRGNPGNAACAYFLFKDQELIDFGGKFLGIATNNNAEYNGLILGLKCALKMGINDLNCMLDSELVVKQINGEYKISNEDIKILAFSVLKEKDKFSNIAFIHIPRKENKNADKLVNVILDNLLLD